MFCVMLFCAAGALRASDDRMHALYWRTAWWKTISFYNLWFVWLRELWGGWSEVSTRSARSHWRGHRERSHRGMEAVDQPNLPPWCSGCGAYTLGDESAHLTHPASLTTLHFVNEGWDSKWIYWYLCLVSATGGWGCYGCCWSPLTLPAALLFSWILWKATAHSPVSP